MQDRISNWELSARIDEEYKKNLKLGIKSTSPYSDSFVPSIPVDVVVPSKSPEKPDVVTSGEGCQEYPYGMDTDFTPE